MRTLVLFVLVLLAGLAQGQGTPDTFTVTNDKWSLVATKGENVDWQVPTADYMQSHFCHSDNIRTRNGKKLSIPEKMELVRKRVIARDGSCPDLDVLTFDYPRFQTMDTIVKGKRGYFTSWTRAQDAGIVAKQAIRVEMYLRLSQDKQWVFVMIRKFYREYAPEWCANDLKPWAIGVRNDYALPIPRTLFEITVPGKTITVPGQDHEIEIPCPCPPPVVMVPWNGSYHSQGSITSYHEIASLWLTYQRCINQQCPPTIYCPGLPPILPPPPPPPG